MATQSLALPTRLLTRLSRILAITGSMTVLLARMRAALERFVANLTAPNIHQPARLILHRPFAAQTHLLGQEWTFRAVLVVCVTVVLCLGMAAGFGPFARERTRWRLRPAGQWRVQDRSPAVTRDLFENRLPAGVARPLVADLRTRVSSAFQRPTTYSCADMFCLHVFVAWAEVRPQLPPHGLSLKGLLLSGTTPLSTRVSTTVQACFALAETLWLLESTLVTNSRHRITTTATRYRNPEHTSTTWTGVTKFFTWMSTWQCLTTRFKTVWNGVLAGRSRGVSRYLRQRRLSTRTIEYDIGRPWTMCGLRILRMTTLLAEVNTAVERTVANFSATEAALPAFNLTRIVT